jgi:phosphatidate cytidylyltransferase
MTQTSPDAAASPHGRAGRNLFAAITVGVLLAALVLVTIFTATWSFVVLVVVALLIAVQELAGAAANRGIQVVRLPLLIGAVAVMVTPYVWGIPAMFVSFAVTVLVLLAWRLSAGPERFVADAGTSVLILAYAPLMAAFAVLMVAEPQGAQRIVAFVVLTVGNDIGGYAAGVLFGKHPIAPRLSPKKSWEGFAGSLVVQVLAGIGLFVWMFHAPWWQGAVVGAVLTVTATLGDFVESAIKRDLGVKDMGSILPGHGGIMDRLDSLIFNAFTSWALLAWFLGA